MRDQAERLRQLVAGTAGAPMVQPSDSPGDRRPRVVAVTSGKGGVGKTTIAVNLAVLLSMIPARVLVVDADLGLANVDVMLGVEPGRHIGHLLLPGTSADEVAATGPNGITVISGGSGLRELAGVGDRERATILEKLSEFYKGFDWVVVDTSPGISRDVTDFLRDAGDVLVTTTTEPTALRDTYAALKTLWHEIPDARISIVVTSASGGQGKAALDAINRVTSKFLDRRYERWFQVETDSMVSRTIKIGKPIVRAFPASPAAVCLRNMVNEIIDNPAPVPARMGGSAISLFTELHG